MTRTPWGDSSELRDRVASPGPGTPEAREARSQQERVFGAMVAMVAAKGFEATTVSDLVELSGVSRRAFYRHFESRQSCFLATGEALLRPTIELLEQAEIGSGEDPASQSLEAFLGLVADQPAAAKLAFVEIYSAGPDGMDLLDRTLERFASFISGLLDETPGSGEMPKPIVWAMIGGVQKVIYRRLYRGEEGSLTELAPEINRWWRSYPSPPGPLRARRRTRTPLSFEARQEGANLPERVLRGLAAVVAEKGYQAATVADVVDRAATSQRTFYEHFPNKEEALLAALDSGSARMLGAALPAFRRADNWPQAVRRAYEAMFAFGVEEPEYTRLGAVEMHAAGQRPLRKRDLVLEGLEGLLAPGFELKPDAPPVAAEAISGAITALAYRQVKAGGPESLPELVPLATYLTLTPFMTAEESHAIAMESARRDP